MPDWNRYIRGHLPPLNVGPERENAIVAELALQLEQSYTEALNAGMPEQEARRKVEGQLGDWQALARAINAAERPPEADSAKDGLFSGIAQDVRYAARFLKRNPAFAAIAIATLGFGIGGNTAIFTLVDAVALRGLPYRTPDRLMAIETRKSQEPELEPWTSALDFFDIRERAKSFSAVAGISPVWNLVMTGRGEAERLECLYVSADFFPILGAGAALGRTFAASEDLRTQHSTVVILSHSFWQRRFAGDPNVVGQTVALDGGTYNIIGVLPADFRYMGEPVAGTIADIDVFFPLSANPIVQSVRNLRFLKVIGQLKPGVTKEQGREEIRSLGAALVEQYPNTNRGYTFDSLPLKSQVTGKFRVGMLLLLGTVGFVLLMACANVANLLLARASLRQREVSIRSALGASRFRLFRQLLTEGFVLATAGGLFGLLVGFAGLRMLLGAAPESLVHARQVSLDGRALFFTAAAVLLCALLAGLPPAWRMVRADLESALRESGRSLTGGHHLLRSSLAALQVAVALLLLVGAGLLIRSFQRLLDVNPGFRAQNLVTISTQMPQSAGSPPQRAAMLRLLRERLLAVPGVESMAAVSRLPMMGSNLSVWLYTESMPTAGQPGHDVEYRVATPDYFATMGIPLRGGRFFDDRDDATPAAGLLINESGARKFWPGQDPVGKRVRLGSNPERSPWVNVIGVVGDSRHFGLDTEPRPEIYRPYALNPLSAPILVIRTSADPAPLIGTLSARVRSVNAGVPAYNVYPMQALLDRSTAQRRFIMLLLTGFAIAALLLAGVGIYGTVSQSVAQRTQEIGLRMALGASPGAALAMVFQYGIRFTAIGIVAGGLAAAGVTQLMRNMLFDVRPLDPVVFLAAAITLTGFSAAACYIPARRATRVDPVIALRQDC